MSAVHDGLTDPDRFGHFEEPALCVFPNMALLHLGTGRGSLVVPKSWSPRVLKRLSQQAAALKTASLATGPAFLMHLLRFTDVHGGGRKRAGPTCTVVPRLNLSHVWTLAKRSQKAGDEIASRHSSSALRFPWSTHDPSRTDFAYPVRMSRNNSTPRRERHRSTRPKGIGTIWATGFSPTTKAGGMPGEWLNPRMSSTSSNASTHV